MKFCLSAFLSVSERKILAQLFCGYFPSLSLIKKNVNGIYKALNLHNYKIVKTGWTFIQTLHTEGKRNVDEGLKTQPL